jgi:precorrin-6B methylase 2
MKFLALLVFLLSCTLGIDAASGQGFRGSAAGSRGASFAAQSGSTVIQTRSGFAGGAVIVTPQVRSFAVAPIVQFHTPAPVVVPYVVPYYYRPAFVRRYPSVVIIDAPYVSERTVVTQVAPGVVQAERRSAENPPSDTRTRASGQLAPFDPTPQEVVARMLKLVALRHGDMLYDLGAGDGRMVIAAAKKYGVKAVGFEIDPGLVKLARENVRKQGVENLVEIRQQDFLSADLAPASVVTLYLSYDGNLVLRPKLLGELKPGARVVSYAFDMGEWQPKITERYRDGGGDTHMIYYWQIGEPLAFR